MNVEPFEQYIGNYEDWFERNTLAYEAELQAVRLFLQTVTMLRKSLLLAYYLNTYKAECLDIHSYLEIVKNVC